MKNAKIFMKNMKIILGCFIHIQISCGEDTFNREITQKLYREIGGEI